MVRRLHFEATTLIVASLKEQVTCDASDPNALVKKIPAAEKRLTLRLHCGQPCDTRRKHAGRACTC